MAAILPRAFSRDPAARAVLDATSRAITPTVLAAERVLPLTGVLGELLPQGLRRGSVVEVHGELGGGATSVALALTAAATAAGEWAALVDLTGTLGGRAAAEAGVALERFAVIRSVPPDRFATVVAALLDGIGMVVAEIPRHARGGDARRLVARARERGVVLVPLTTSRSGWPADTTVRLHAESGAWHGLESGSGLLDARSLHVRVEGRGAAARARHATLSRVSAAAG